MHINQARVDDLNLTPASILRPGKHLALEHGAGMYHAVHYSPLTREIRQARTKTIDAIHPEIYVTIHFQLLEPHVIL